MTETVLHDVVKRTDTASDERVDRQAGQTAALERDRPVTLVLDERLEHLVSQPQERFLPVHGFPEAEQAGGRPELLEQVRQGGTDVGATFAGEGPAGILDRRSNGHGESRSPR
jgi:hypothetical protein